MDDVVVLPCAPATDMPLPQVMICTSASDLCITGICLPPRFYYFCVRFADCRRDDDDFGILQIFRLLADADARALFGKFIRNGRPLEVRPRYDISFFYENVGYCPHACAGNADKMYFSYVVEIDHGLNILTLRRFPCVGAIDNASFAMSWAA